MKTIKFLLLGFGGLFIGAIALLIFFLPAFAIESSGNLLWLLFYAPFVLAFIFFALYNIGKDFYELFFNESNENN